jgi:hypothetical protein
MASPAAKKIARCASVVAAACWSLRESISKAGFDAMKNDPQEAEGDGDHR